MDNWNTAQHKKSGLYERVLKSSISCKMAEEETIQFLENLVNKNSSPMCGNSIYQDRIFLKKYMPTLENFFHYRNIDVSTLKELVKFWKPDLYEKFKKKSKHIALEDIKESISELIFYKKILFDNNN